MEGDTLLSYQSIHRTLCWLWLLIVIIEPLNFVTLKEFKEYLVHLRRESLTKKRWANNVFQVTLVENDRVRAKTQTFCYPKKSETRSLTTSDHLALRFHFPCPQTSCLPPDPSVSPRRNFPKSSTPNCLPVINQLPDVVPSQGHDFSYPTWQCHCLFQFFRYPIPHWPKPHSSFVLNPSVCSRQSYIRNWSEGPWLPHKEAYSLHLGLQKPSLSHAVYVI